MYITVVRVWRKVGKVWSHVARAVFLFKHSSRKLYEIVTM